MPGKGLTCHREHQDSTRQLALTAQAAVPRWLRRSWDNGRRPPILAAPNGGWLLWHLQDARSLLPPDIQLART